MKIFIAGGTGFIGKKITQKLLNSGYKVSIITRNPDKQTFTHDNLEYIYGNPTVCGPWQKSVKDHNIIINLTGESIFKRWTNNNKRKLEQSRILSTRNIVDSLPDDKEITLINASAIGYYGSSLKDTVFIENSEPGNDYLARLCVDWEKEALKAETKNVRVVITRFGIVLGPSGGALSKMIPLFKSGFGHRLGSGKQYFSWIHIDELANIIEFIINNDHIKGPVNCVAPEPVTNKQLTKALSKVVKRPVLLPAAPSIAMKLVLGEFGDILLKGQKVTPDKLSKCAYEFQYKTIEEALKNLLV